MSPKATTGRRADSAPRAFAAAILTYVALAALPQAAHAQPAPAPNGFLIKNATNHTVQCTYNHGMRTFDYSTAINSGGTLNINDSDVSTLRLLCKGVSNDRVFDQFENGRRYGIMDRGNGPELVQVEN